MANLFPNTSCEFYYDGITVTSIINVIYRDVTVESNVGMSQIKVATNYISRFFHILKIDRMTPFCKAVVPCWNKIILKNFRVAQIHRTTSELWNKIKLF